MARIITTAVTSSSGTLVKETDEPVTKPKPSHTKGAPVSVPPGSPLSAKETLRLQAGQFAQKLAQLSQNRLVYLNEPAQIVGFAEQELAGRPQRLAVGGYFKSPTPEHYRLATAFVKGLVEELGPKKVALVTSPTTQTFGDGTASTDFMSTQVAHDTGARAFYVSSVGYAPKFDLTALPTMGDRRVYANTNKYLLPDNDAYGLAAMTASNGLVITGGRVNSVADFVKAVKRGNRVFLLADRALGEASWESEAKRPADAAAYLRVMLAAADRLLAEGKPLTPEALPLPLMPEQHFDLDFLRDHAAALRTRVTGVEVGSLVDLPDAIALAKAHFQAGTEAKR